MAMTRNKNLHNLKQRLENTCRLGQNIVNTQAYLDKQIDGFSFLHISLDAWNGVSMEMVLLGLLTGAAEAFLAYWYELDASYIVLYASAAVMSGLFLAFIESCFQIDQKQQRLETALLEYVDNSVFLRDLLEVNGRYDGSSKFPKDSRFGFFPSVSLGWNVAQEKFMEVTRNYIDGLKIRASYGVIGNQNVVNYAYFPTMSVSNKYNGWLSGGDYVTAINSLPNLVSTSFTWEKVATTDIGLDLNMFGNRLNAVFDWYQRDTKGMLAPGMQLPAVVGASSPFQNTADMRTRGWELAVNWRDRIGKFNYRVGFNLSDSYSEITKYDDNAASKLLSNFYPGQRLGEIWGYEVDGFYTVDDFVDTNSWKLKDGVASIKGVSPRPGDLKFKNLRDDDKSTNQIDSGDGTLDNPGDQKVIGNSLPKYLYGITLGANYKGFDLNIMMQGTGQRDAWIANNLVFPMYIYSVNDIKYQPLFDGLTDYWKPVDAANGDYTAVNPNAKYPRMYGQNPTVGSNYGRKTDRYLSNAAYFRIKNVTLSYTVPKTWISRIGLNQLKGFVSVENLATFSSLPSGIDPETLSWNYPAFRTVSFGINFTL